MPDPEGYDPGHEWVELQNAGGTAAAMNGWAIRDAGGDRHPLTGELAPGETRRVTVLIMSLNNGGDSLVVQDEDGKTVDRFDYTADQVREGVIIEAMSPAVD
jgi:hypothetical protein